MAELAEILKSLGPVLIAALGVLGAYWAYRQQDAKRASALTTDPRSVTAVVSGALASRQEAAENTAAIRELAVAVTMLAKSNVADAIEDLAKATRLGETDQVKLRQYERFLEEIVRMRQAAEAVARHELRGS